MFREGLRVPPTGGQAINISSGSSGSGSRRTFEGRDRLPQGQRINHRIRVPQVRVVADDGSMLGVLDTQEALRMARDRGLDLVEVNPKAVPPVCKIMDFGKFKYEEKKRTAEARKRQTSVEIKEIKLRPKTDEHDLNFKVKHALRFLEDGNKVKITCRFRGREITHPEMARRQLQYMVDQTKGYAVVELDARMEGRTMTLVLSPKAAGARPRPTKPEPQLGGASPAP